MEKLAEGTASFFLKMNTLFDHFNASVKSSANRDSGALSSSDPYILNSLKEFLKWISKWKSTGAMEKPYCFGGKLECSVIIIKRVES